MIEQHVHCADCLEAIPTKVKGEDGKEQSAAIHVGSQLAMVETPDGIRALPKPVPMCTPCFERLGQARLAQPKPTLIIPSHMVN